MPDAAVHERWFAVLNPASGGGRALRDRLTHRSGPRRCRCAHSCWRSASIQGTRSRWSQTAAREGFRRFIAIGGDGTLNEVVNGLLRAGTPSGEATLALVPVGRGNDWARTTAFPAASSKRSG